MKKSLERINSEKTCTRNNKLEQKSFIHKVSLDFQRDRDHNPESGGPE